MGGTNLAALPAWVAASRDPCPRCGVRGDLGCAHQRPFDPPAIPRLPDRPPVRTRRFTAAEDADIVRQRDAGTGPAAIARAMGRERSSIVAALDRLDRRAAWEAIADG